MKRVKALLSLIFLSISGPAFGAEKAVTTDPNQLFATEISTAKKIVDLIVEFSLKYSFQVLGGLIVLGVGWFLAKFTAKFLEKFMAKHNVDVTVRKFVITMIKIVVIALAALIALGKFGITIAPFIAGLSVVGFGTSFALQGPLSNYASGLTLIFTKPFKVGDIIEVTGVVGEVQDMTLARTELKTVDGNTIVIPNKHIIGEIIHNYAEFKKLDITVGVSYATDMDKAINIVKDIVKNEQRVVSAPEAKVGISEFADSSINIYARLWCKQVDYWDVMFDINNKINSAFNKENINIPFPQRDVHIYKDN